MHPHVSIEIDNCVLALAHVLALKWESDVPKGEPNKGRVWSSRLCLRPQYCLSSYHDDVGGKT